MAAQVYPGNTADPTTVPDEAETLKRRFGLSRAVRAMLTQTQIERLREHPGHSLSGRGGRLAVVAV
ncbi:MAG: hypothetical protein O3C40_28660 [Planctomycetota bacterium]|nr:hypothetical protein [Planctomycetota bacterium]